MFYYDLLCLHKKNFKLNVVNEVCNKKKFKLYEKKIFTIIYYILLCFTMNYCILLWITMFYYDLLCLHKKNFKLNVVNEVCNKKKIQIV